MKTTLRKLGVLCMLVWFASEAYALTVSITSNTGNPSVTTGVTTCQATAFSYNISGSGGPFAVTVTLDANQVASNATFAAGTASISGNVITFTYSGTGTLSSTFSYTSSVIACTPSLTVAQTIAASATGTFSYTVDGTSGRTYTYPVTYPLITDVTDHVAGISAALSTGGTVDVPTEYINSGSKDYTGQLTINNPQFPCSGVTITKIEGFIAGSTTAAFSITSGIGSTNLIPSSITIPVNSKLKIVHTLALSSGACIPAGGCIASPSVSVTFNSCSNTCGTSLPIPIKLTAGPSNATIRVVRVTPGPPSYGLSYNNNRPWLNENSGLCNGPASATQDYEFVIENMGSVDLSNLQIKLADQNLASQTFIIAESITLTDPAIPNYLPGAPPTDLTPYMTYLSSADYPLGAPLCLNDISAFGAGGHFLKGFNMTLPLTFRAVGASGNPASQGDRLILKFKTYRCCGSDVKANAGVFFDKWKLYVSAQTPCLTSPSFINPSNPITLANTSSGSTITAYNTFMQSEAFISAGPNVNGPDMSLQQSFSPLNTTVYGGSGGPGQVYTYSVYNNSFGNPVSGTVGGFLADFYSNTETSVGGNIFATGLRGQMKVEIDYGNGNLQTGLRSGTPYVTISKNGVDWVATTVIDQPTSKCTAIFDLASLPTSIASNQTVGITNQDFSGFMTGSNIIFDLQATCPTPSTGAGSNVNPTVKINTYFNPNATGLTACPCFIPLAQVSMLMQIKCPGCTSPGIITDNFVMVRTSFGLPDANNNMLADDPAPITASFNADYTSFASTSGYSNFSNLAIGSALPGDNITSVISGTLFPGEETVATTTTTNGTTTTTYKKGFTIDNWHSANSNAPFLTHLYVQQDITNALLVGLAYTGYKVFYYPGGNTTAAPVIYTYPPMSNPVQGTAISGPTHIYDGRFIFHIAASDLGQTEFSANDRFRIVTNFVVGANPPATTAGYQLNDVVEMYTTSTALNSPTENYSNVTLAGGWVAANVPYATPTASTKILYFCEGNSGVNTVYGIGLAKGLTYITDYNACKKYAATSVTTGIGGTRFDGGTDYFPYEFRAIPNTVLTAAGPTPVEFNGDLHALTGYTFVPDQIYTTVYYKNGTNNQTTTVYPYFSVSGTPSCITPNANLTAGTPVTYKANTQVLDVIPTYEPGLLTNFTNTSSGNLVDIVTNTISGKKSLLMSDGSFTEVLKFNILADCNTAGNGTQTSSDIFSVNFAPIYTGASGGTLGATNGISLTTPNTTLSMVFNPVASGYPKITGGTITSQAILSTNSGWYANNPPEYIYVATSALPAGVTMTVSASATGANPITPTIINGYALYDIQSISTLTNNHSTTFYISLNVANCNNAGSTISLPVYYGWGCSGAPTAIPVSTNACYVPGAPAVLDFAVPTVHINTSLALATGTAATFQTCTLYKLALSVQSQQYGGFGNMVGTITVPAGFSVVGGPNAVNVGFIVNGVQTAGTNYTIITTGTPNSSQILLTQLASPPNTYQIDLSRVTAFTTAGLGSLVGADGLNNADGTMVVTFSIKANCNVKSTQPDLNVNAQVTGYSYCNLAVGSVADVYAAPPALNLVPATVNFNPCAPIITTSVSPVTCTASSALTVKATVSYNTGYSGTSFSYVWSKNSLVISTTSGSALSTNSVSAQSNGQYVVNVTDNNSCSVTATLDAMLLTAAASATNTCGAGNNGVITATGSHGKAPYTYAWSNAATTATISGLATGSTYTVTITDANSCSATATATVPAPPVLSATLSPGSIACHGGATTVSASPTGGGYQYSWSTGATTSSISNATAGAYSVTITNNGCSATASVMVTEPAQLTVTATSSSAGCSGASNGTVTATAGGGASPYTYAWTNSTGGSVATTGLASGTYTVVATDANGCTATANTTMTAGAGFVASLTAGTIACHGGNTSVTASPSGDGYQYSWNTGATTASISNATAGIYSVTITNNGCTAAASVTVTEPAQIAVVPVATSASCLSNNGSIALTISGGTGPYMVTLDGAAGVATTGTLTINSIAAGSHVIGVTDATGCAVTVSCTVPGGSGVISTLCTSASLFDILSGEAGYGHLDITGIDAGPDGSIYVAGTYTDIINLYDHQEAGTSDVILPASTSNAYDYFLIKYDCNGTRQWHKEVVDNSVAVLSKNNFSFVKVDPCSGDVHWNYGSFTGNTAFSAYDQSGTAIWVTSLQPTSDVTYLTDFAYDNAGIYIMNPYNDNSYLALIKLDRQYIPCVGSGGLGSTCSSNFLWGGNSPTVSTPNSSSQFISSRLKVFYSGGAEYVCAAATGYIGIFDPATGASIGSYTNTALSYWGPYCRMDVDPTGSYVAITDGAVVSLYSISITSGAATITFLGNLSTTDAKDVKLTTSGVIVATFNQIDVYSYSGTLITSYSPYAGGTPSLTSPFNFYSRSLCMYGNTELVVAGPTATNDILRNGTNYGSGNRARAFLEKYTMSTGAAFKTSESQAGISQSAVHDNRLDLLNLVPNPASSEVSVIYSIAEASGPLQLEVYDILGQSVANVTLQEYSGVQKLDIKAFAPGAYTVAINCNSRKVLTKRLLKD